MLFFGTRGVDLFDFTEWMFNVATYPAKNNAWLSLSSIYVSEDTKLEAFNHRGFLRLELFFQHFGCP